MLQKKEHVKTKEKQGHEVQTGNVQEKIIIIIIMTVKETQDLGKRTEAKIEKMQEMVNKDLEDLKSKQMERTIQ